MDPHSTSESGQPPQTHVTPPRSLFADSVVHTPTAPPDSLPAPNVAAKPFNVLTRVVLPLGIFIAGVAVLAWIIQQIPGRGGPKPSSDPEGGKGGARAVLALTGGQDVPNKGWGFMTQSEVGTEGSHDFPFKNTVDHDVDFGISKTNCQCARVRFGIFKGTQGQQQYQNAIKLGNTEAADAGLNWEDLAADADQKKSVRIPANAEGVLRVHWHGKTEPVPQELEIVGWTRKPGMGQERSFYKIHVWVIYLRPVLFNTEKVDLGILYPGDSLSGSFYCMSATRDLEVKSASKDKCLVVDVVPLKGKEFEKHAMTRAAACAIGLLQGEQGPFQAFALWGAGLVDQTPDEFKQFGKIVSAFRVNVKLYENKDGKQLDLGLYREDVPLVITSQGKTIDSASGIGIPALRASVRGDITLQLPPEEGHKIDFRLFRIKDRPTRNVVVLAPLGSKLTAEGYDSPLVPVKVELKPLSPEAQQARWEMTVTIEPYNDPGPLPEDGVIVLNCELPAQAGQPAVTRKIRIPVTGSGTSR
jgi:hypothetical protein